MTIDEMIAVLQAAKVNKPIQVRDGDEWVTVCSIPTWNFRDFQYRVKPEPREWWINVYSNNACHLHLTKDAAVRGRTDGHDRLHGEETIHVREVLEDQP